MGGGGWPFCQMMGYHSLKEKAFLFGIFPIGLKLVTNVVFIKSYLDLKFQVSTETGRSQEELMAEAKDIVEEMGHAFTMKNIRMLGYMFPKVYRRLYEHIYVNREGVDKVKI